MSFAPRIEHSLIATDSIGDFTRQTWDFEPSQTILLHSGFNDTYRLDSADESRILRLYRVNRWPQIAIEEEMKALLQLQTADVPAIVPVPLPQGNYLAKMACPEGPRWAALFERIEGSFPFPPDEIHSGRHGRLLAMIHQTFAGSQYQHRWTIGKTALVDESLATLRMAFPHRLREIDDLEHQLEALSPLLAETEPIQRIHGDFIYTNLIATGERTTAIDFDLTGNGSPVYDLSCYKWGLSSHLSPPELDAAWESFLAGYRTVRPIKYNEITLKRHEVWRELWVWAVHVQEGKDFRRLVDFSFDHRLGRLRQRLDAVRD
jgi:Ser/Thr protein kinase RdoA (MazF antagonist)